MSLGLAVLSGFMSEKCPTVPCTPLICIQVHDVTLLPGTIFRAAAAATPDGGKKGYTGETEWGLEQNGANNLTLTININ